MQYSMHMLDYWLRQMELLAGAQCQIFAIARRFALRAADDCGFFEWNETFKQDSDHEQR